MNKILNVLLSVNFYYLLILLSNASEHSSMLIAQTGNTIHCILCCFKKIRVENKIVVIVQIKPKYIKI